VTLIAHLKENSSGAKRASMPYASPVAPSATSMSRLRIFYFRFRKESLTKLMKILYYILLRFHCIVSYWLRSLGYTFSVLLRVSCYVLRELGYSLWVIQKNT